MFPERPPLTSEQAARTPDVVHPLVRIHPETGRRSLFLTANKAAWEIVGLPREDGQKLLADLLAHSLQEQFRHVHVWRDHDYLIRGSSAVLVLNVTLPHPRSVGVIMRQPGHVVGAGRGWPGHTCSASAASAG